MTAAFVAPPSWWQNLLEQLDDDGREKLRRGELTYTAMTEDGLESVALVPPAWLFEELS